MLTPSNDDEIYISFAIISGSYMCDASQLPPDRLVLSITSMVAVFSAGEEVAISYLSISTSHEKFFGFNLGFWTSDSTTSLSCHTATSLGLNNMPGIEDRQK